MIQISEDLNVAGCDIFSELYPKLNHYVNKNGRMQRSRYGQTVEIDSFKTVINDPYKRCVGGYRRDVNIFFLLAEAMWIWAGRRDVKFLSIFNSRMKEFSDDGKVFHAPYGWRLRNYNTHSADKYSEENKHSSVGIDQIEYAVNMLKDNMDDRRVVLSIWNPNFDLGTKSKDIPCNDLLMYKVRDGKLNLTISNRSNDLHWGLPTNLFQFSFMSELISNILGIKLGRQIHNSDSLHIYTDNPINSSMMRAHNNGNSVNLYSDCYQTNMFFDTKDVSLSFVDKLIVDSLDSVEFDKTLTINSDIKLRSVYFFYVCELLKIYKFYTQNKNRDKYSKMEAIQTIVNLHNKHKICYDYTLLAINWFIVRLDQNDSKLMKTQIAKMSDSLPVYNLGNY